MLKCPGQDTVYIIIDALDECPTTTGFPTPREKVLELVEELVNLRIRHLQNCVTSRPEADIASDLALAFRSISLEGESGQVKDIAEFIESVVNTDKVMRKWKDTDKQLVIEVLSKKADGMLVIHMSLLPVCFIYMYNVEKLLDFYSSTALDANALDIDGQTPLHYMLYNGRLGAARVLLEHGVDANTRDINNATALHLASSNPYLVGEDRSDVVRSLLQYGSDIHARDNSGRTPFMIANGLSLFDIMEMLSEHGAEVHRN